MKKLLSILAVASLTAVSPLSVVSCKKETKEEIIDEFDYIKLFNNFIADVTTIYEATIFESFMPYSWITKDELPSGITINDLLINKDQLKNPQSDFFKKVSKEIYKIVPVNQVNRNLIRDVSNNINYSPILIDNETPLKNGINVDSIDVYEKGDNLTLGVKLSAAVYFKDEAGNKTQQQIFTITSINIFAERDAAQAAKEISEIYFQTLNGTYANDYSFESDSGDLEKTIDELNKKQSIVTDAQAKVDAMDLKDVDMRLKPSVSSSGVKIAVNSGITTDSSSYASFSNLGQYSDRGLTVNKSLAGNETSYELYMRNIKNESTGDWLTPVLGTDADTLEMVAAAEADSKMSLSINQYNLNHNLKENVSFQTMIESQNSKFKIDFEKDKKSIALFGIKVSGATFFLTDKNNVEQEYDLPTQTIFYKQNTTYDNTKSLYEDFIESAFNYQKAFLGLEGTVINEEQIDRQAYYISLPESYKSNISYGSLTYFRYLSEIIATSNQEANSLENKFNMTTALVGIEDNKVPKFYMMISSKPDDLHLLNGYNEKTNQNVLKTYFFSSGLTNKNKFSYYFDQPADRQYIETGKNESELNLQIYAFNKCLWKIKWISTNEGTVEE
ncbi:hypothetical protein [Spiroplasma alleghenense]|uniref:Lipoprotein n=1 Tax=Spiroplasma alleghenense TaxID=216931 RepID=A0A345Z560_9MOLU|nr:hypothetical protein [Spiroplasma alleghenense]AXK51739.1 hypothetical protein SALLE_v1c10690 [Spiroplasma alleghenense]